MEYRIYEPIRRGPRHTAVELSDLQNNHEPAVLGRELHPASPELIDFLWQREAAMAALNGIKSNLQPGIHRMTEQRRPFFDVREHIAEPLRRELGRSAAGVLKLRDTFAPGLRIIEEPEPVYVGLDGLGFTSDGAEPTEHHEPATQIVLPAAVGRASVPNTPEPATTFFTNDELSELRRTVEQTHPRIVDIGYKSLNEPAAV